MLHNSHRTKLPQYHQHLTSLRTSRALMLPPMLPSRTKHTILRVMPATPPFSRTPLKPKRSQHHHQPSHLAACSHPSATTTLRTRYTTRATRSD